MAFPKSAFLVVRRLASGPEPPWPFQYHIHLVFRALGCLRDQHLAARRTVVAGGSVL
jgi:hypothetical protein